MDEYEAICGGRYPEMITGKPVEMGRSLGRTEVTGYSVLYTLREALKSFNMDIAKQPPACQGFGNVAEYAACLYTMQGETIKAIF